jgi:uncharacterized protein YcaQ
VYDLVERLFPAALLADQRSVGEQHRHKLLSRYRAHGLLGRSGSAELWSGISATRLARRPDRPLRGDLLAELVEAGTLVPVGVEGVRGERFMLADEAPILASVAGRDDTEAAASSAGAAFLAPLDPLVWDRDFLRALYDFDYVWEVYVPAAKRRWGYYVLPILFGDRLVGRIEPRIDRRAGVLRVLGLWWETGFEPLAETGFVEAFTTALEAHARFVEVSRIALPRSTRRLAVIPAVRARLGPGGRVRA